MTASPRARPGSGLVRLALYYVALGVLAVALVRYVPAVHDAFALGKLTSSASGELFGPGSGRPIPVTPEVHSPFYGPVLALVSMLGALTIMVPVTWVYMLTRRLRGYEESVVHTLLILPVAITGIVIIVQNSLALAFSLAGIVAAVRFRTTLDDTKDAVYVFLSIGVGLSTGVQAMGVAVTLSMVFNAVALVLWWTRFGNVYADRHRDTGSLPLSDVLAGAGAGMSALRVGDPGLLDAAATTDLGDAVERASRIERHVSEERGKSKRRRANTLVMVHAAEAQVAQQACEEHLDDLAARWKLAEISPGPSGTVTLYYLVRFDDPATQGAFVDRLRAASESGVRGAELVSLKGLSQRS